MTATNRFPIIIDDCVFEYDRFTRKSIVYPYDSIVSLRFTTQMISINLSQDEVLHFEMRLKDDQIIGFHVADANFTFNQKKVAEKKASLRLIHAYLDDLTYDRRLAAYYSQLKAGRVVYKFTDGGSLKTAEIYADGNVILGNKVYNILKSSQNGTLKFGTAYGFGCDFTINPYEISINEKKPFFSGLIEGFGSMRIDGSWDHPMIFGIMQGLLSALRGSK